MIADGGTVDNCLREIIQTFKGGRAKKCLPLSNSRILIEKQTSPRNLFQPPIIRIRMNLHKLSCPENYKIIYYSFVSKYP